MFLGLLSFLFSLSSVLLILLVLIQKGKSGLGIGNLSGSNQMLFGGSGGQDIFQKITWILGALLMAGSLGLSILKSRQANSDLRAIYSKSQKSAPAAEKKSDAQNNESDIN